MSEKDRNAFERYTREEQLHRECVSQPVGVAVRYSRREKESAQRSLPITHRAFGFRLARPKHESSGALD